MDLFTHFVIPFALLAALRRPMAERLAAGIGGWAPDFDTLLAWTQFVDDRFYFLGHRGLSHSLLGAPIFALVVLALLCLPAWERRWPKMAVWRFTLPTVLIAMAASYTHLILDYLTVWGIPPFYPWSLERYSLNWFFYSVSGAILVSGWIVWRLWRGIWKGTWDDRHLWKGLAVLAVVVVVSGTIRYVSHPDVPPGTQTQPGSLEWQWRAYTRNETGWTVAWYSAGNLQGTRHYNETPPPDPASEAALARARESHAYTSYRLYSWGPIIGTVEPRGDGGAWNVTFIDLTRSASLSDDRRGLASFWGNALRLEVTPDAVLRLD